VAASHLNVNQPKTSALSSYHLDGFSVERLMIFFDRPGPGRRNSNSTQAEIAKSWSHPNDGSPALSFRPSLGVFVKMLL
jgi:hypothetical protein